MRRPALKKLVLCIAAAMVASGRDRAIPVLIVQAVQNTPSAHHDWPIYGGAPENTHYSDLAQINRENVKQLQVAWSFDTGESGGLQTSPIIVAGVLYAYS